MRVLISGICGFAGSKIAAALSKSESCEVVGIDNLSRRGSWTNLLPLQSAGVQVVHGDVRCPSDIAACGRADWVVDAAANPSVLAGLNQASSSQQLAETNLLGTLNLLEYCKSHEAGCILLSTSRVYSIPLLTKLPLEVGDQAFRLAYRTEAYRTTSSPAEGKPTDVSPAVDLPGGISPQGISEECATTAPISLYGATKLAAEALALEYQHAFEFPVWVNRCGVLAGGGQFGKADQGIFSYWLHGWLAERPLRYIGFSGSGHQVRDCLHPSDLAALIALQIREPSDSAKPRIVNVSGGIESARSLAQLSAWCAARWGARAVAEDPQPRTYDLPWIVLDAGLARRTWGWQPQVSTPQILTEIAQFAENHPDWLNVCES